MEKPIVVALFKSEKHTFKKFSELRVEIVEGFGVKDDAHAGKTVKHRSRVAKNPDQPNLRQVHLIHSELHEELKEKGFDIAHGEMGENITTKNIDLLGLPKNTILEIGDVSLQVTGLRNPCLQLEGIQKGLMKALLDKDEEGSLIRKAGIMTIVLKGGVVDVGNGIKVVLPTKPYMKLERV